MKNFETTLRSMSAGDSAAEWQKPEVVDGMSRLDELAAQGVLFRENIDELATELAEYRTGKKGASHNDELAARDHMLETSNLVHLPWSRELVRYPEQSDHLLLRTARNRNLLTLEEQEALYRDVRPAVFGLSVGSNIVDSLTQAGMGEAYLLADYDRLAPTNLNRIRANMADVGLRKTVIAGRKMAMIDPYIDQLHLNSGYVEAETDEVLREWRPTIIFDEVDNFSVKAMLRRVARELKAPLVMVGDIGDNAIVDVERYDIDENQQPFNGKVPEDIYERLLRNEQLDDMERVEVLLAINGIENISDRLVMSVGDESLSGSVPQLGSTAARGASLAERITRSIALKKDELPSGTYVDNPNSVLGVKPL